MNDFDEMYRELLGKRELTADEVKDYVGRLKQITRTGRAAHMEAGGKSFLVQELEGGGVAIDMMTGGGAVSMGIWDFDFDELAGAVAKGVDK